jgi:hypothetical protein
VFLLFRKLSLKIETSTRIFVIKTNMINFVSKIIQKRIEKVPATNILKDSLAMAGGMVGFVASIKDIFKYENGFLIRPITYTAFGGGLGFVSGLYPFHCLTVLVGMDLMYCLRQKKN